MMNPADSTAEFLYIQTMATTSTKNLTWPYRLLTPGPVPLHPEVRKILEAPMLHHRTPQFQTIFKSALEGLKDAFSTERDVYIHTSTGSGAMESAVLNTLSPGDEVLVIVSGKFGERWADICRRFGLETHVLNVAWGHAVEPVALEREMKAHPNLRAVLTQACETSTATLHPVKQVAEVVRRFDNCLLIVDAITAVGAVELEMDDWGLDVVIGGSQKAFMLPTGLSFIALSEKAWQAHLKSKLPKFYWDLSAEKASLEKGESHFSSSVPMITALDYVLSFLTGGEKLKTRQRIRALAERTRAVGAELGLECYSKSPSPSVTALTVPAGIDGQKLRAHLEHEFNITVMGGQDQLKGKILRIGHLGYILDSDMDALFEALKLSLKQLTTNGD